MGQAGIEYVVVPVEHSLAGVLQELEEAGFHFVQHVEADEHIAVITQ